jgi:C-terminal processing protease CtpA/Prc
MKIKFAVAMCTAALLTFSLAVQPAAGDQEQSANSAATTIQSDQVQREIQAELERAKVELARAMQEVKSKATEKAIAAKLSAHRSVMLADLQSRLSEINALAQERVALAQEKAEREVESQMQLFDSGGGWLGVQIGDVDAQKVKELKLPAERGVVISEVEKDSPASKAGLQANDVITECNGQRVESAAQFRRMISESLPGRTAQLTVWRDGRAQTLSATLGSGRDRIDRVFTMVGPHEPLLGGRTFSFAMPEVFASTRAPMLGINAEDLSGQLGSYFGAPGGEGILVREVNTGSPAEKAGMKAGDVITKVDNESVSSLEQLREKLRAKRESKTVSIGVLRKGSAVALNVEIEQPKPPERRRITRRITL